MKFLLFLFINPVFSLKHISFNKFILFQSKHNDIIPILSSLEKSCVLITKILRSNSLNYDYLDSINIHNEKQSPIDIISNKIIKESLLNLNCVNSIISEEETNICLGSNNGNILLHLIH
jgi:fructose-1,6-bisphosphatase